MSKIFNVFKTIRNNWKKSAFACALIYYGVDYSRNKYEISELMRQYCEEAAKFGELPLPMGSKLRQVIVILNPAANKRKAKANFEKFCGPLLFLAGINVTLVQTEYEGQARGLVEDLDKAVDAIVVAGGDGTLSEAVTGLLRRPDGNLAASRKFPIGVLPLGQTNTVANSLFAADASAVRTMANATMAVIREVTQPLDVMKIEALETEEELPGKPVYCLGSIKWGAYRDAASRRDKYWYWDGLRSYATYVFSGMKGGLTWHCEAGAMYATPCEGCSRCRDDTADQPTENEGSRSRLWQLFLPRRATSGQRSDEQVDYSKIQNSECGMFHEKEISAVEFVLATENVHENCRRRDDALPHLQMDLGPQSVSYADFVSEGWRRVNGQERRVAEKLQIRELRLHPVLPPDAPKDKERWISIDNEDYELKPIHVTLLPKKVHVFCANNNVA